MRYLLTPENGTARVTLNHVAMNTNVATKSVPFDTSEVACFSVAWTVVEL